MLRIPAYLTLASVIIPLIFVLPVLIRPVREWYRRFNAELGVTFYALMCGLAFLYGNPRAFDGMVLVGILLFAFGLWDNRNQNVTSVIAIACVFLGGGAYLITLTGALIATLHIDLGLPVPWGIWETSNVILMWLGSLPEDCLYPTIFLTTLIFGGFTLSLLPKD